MTITFYLLLRGIFFIFVCVCVCVCVSVKMHIPTHHSQSQSSEVTAFYSLFFLDPSICCTVWKHLVFLDVELPSTYCSAVFYLIYYGHTDDLPHFLNDCIMFHNTYVPFFLKLLVIHRQVMIFQH